MIDFENVDLDAPWVSPTAQPFKEGDRVRLNPSPECACWGLSMFGVTKGQFRGLSGTVRAWPLPRPEVTAGHNVTVWLDQDIWTLDGTVRGGFFAPSELELLEAADAAQDE